MTVLVGGMVGVVVVVGVIAAVIVSRRSHDDVHSVEHYHRQLHTLEEMRTHTSPAGPENGNGEAAYPASAFRVSGSSTVRLTEADRPAVPPAPPPPVANPAEPVTFDDSGPEPVPASFMTGGEERVMHAIDHRPRRLGGPAAAVGAVAVLIVVLIVTGLHSNSPTHHPKSSGTVTTTARPHQHAAGRHPTTTTTTTAPLTVSAPASPTAHTATYHVAGASFSLSLAATTGECWVDATDTATGTVLFTGTLLAGQSHAISATGPVTVIAGAPVAFSATVDGSAVTLPLGYQAPFTLSFETAQAT
ncbi:MAG: DUF4115 domain-containing protein [Acidimicrobiales bacterium]